MIGHVNLVLYLICHHGQPDEVLKDAEVIYRVSIEKGVPITYFFSGIELNALYENRDTIHHLLWTDLIDGIKREFINPRLGYNNPYKSELGITPFHHIPLVQLWAQHLWGEYFEGFVKPEIIWSKGVAEQVFHKTPVTCHPPDGVYTLAAAHTLKELGLDTAVMSGEFLGDNRHAKGKLYWASGLRHLVRTNNIQPNSPEFWDAKSFVDAVEAYGHHNNVPFVTVGCDIDEFNGMRGLSLHDGIARLCCIGDEVYRRSGVSMINCNAAAHWNLYQSDATDVLPWNYVISMINDDGKLGWLDTHRNGIISYLIELTGKRYRQGWDVTDTKHHIMMASDIALRNRYFCYDGCLTNYFYDNVNCAKELLEG